MHINMDKQAFAFELDDVLYPKRDYLLQVYYLFAQFLDFTEGSTQAAEITAFMKDRYEQQGESAVFTATQEAFGFKDNYKENFDRLLCNAQLPLKLLLRDDCKKQLLQLFKAGKQVVILTKGNPVMQLNKLKQLDWDVLDAFKKLIKVYFVDELNFRSIESIPYIAQDLQIEATQIEVIDSVA